MKPSLESYNKFIEENVMNISVKNECHVWTGGFDNRDTPIMNVINESGRQTRNTVRQIVWEIVYGERKRARIKTLCDTVGCINPIHLSIKISTAKIEMKRKDEYHVEEGKRYSPVVIQNGKRLLPELVFDKYEDAISSYSRLKLTHGGMTPIERTALNNAKEDNKKRVKSRRIQIRKQKQIEENKRILER